MRLSPQDIRRHGDQPSGVVLRPDRDAQIGRDARLVEMPNQGRTFAQRGREFRPAPRRMPGEDEIRARRQNLANVVLDVSRPRSIKIQF